MRKLFVFFTFILFGYMNFLRAANDPAVTKPEEKKKGGTQKAGEKLGAVFGKGVGALQKAGKNIKEGMVKAPGKAKKGFQRFGEGVKGGMAAVKARRKAETSPEKKEEAAK